MKHYQIISHPYHPEYPKYQIKPKSLANPLIDLIGVVTVILVLLLAGYMHVRIGG